MVGRQTANLAANLAWRKAFDAMRTLMVAGKPVENGAVRTDYPADAETLGRVLADPNIHVWLDIEAPVEEDAQLLREVFHFHPLALEDAFRSRERPKVDVYAPRLLRADGEGDAAPAAKKAALDPAILDAYYFIVFYTAEFNADDTDIVVRSLNLFVGTHYLVTVHHDPIPQIGETAERFRSPVSPLDRRVSVLVYVLLDAIVDDYFSMMDQIADRVEALEDTIFAEAGEDTIQTIFALKKDLLELRHIVAPERDVINVLLRRELPVFRSREMAYLQDIYDHIVRLTDIIDTYRDLASSALDSYLSIQSNNLNQIMKTLTVGSILLMAAAWIAGIYGMNFKYMPELEQRWGYPASLMLMAAVMLGLALFFKRRKWF
jgi:magnesium transporter